MPEQYDHYISKNIISFYKRRLVTPILYLVILTIVWLIFPLSELLFPAVPDASDSLETIYRDDIEYVSLTLTDLKFTGYTQTVWNQTSGYFYYTEIGGECTLVLLSPSTSEEGLPAIDSVHVRARIMEDSSSYESLLAKLSADLSWTESGIKSQVSQFYLSEPANSRIGNIVLFAVLFVTGGYAIVCLILFLVFIRFPFLSPCCQDLALFGNPIKLLEQAEEELATLPQLATEDMFITEHFFIETSVYGNAVVPISEIIWIYKYSTLHKFFWYHFSISYTLHITANKHLYLQCPKNIKSDIDGIIDYLAEANHDILVGFSEENRLKVQQQQGKPLHLEKLLAFLNRRI
jgi:hypothetical protein